MKKQIASFLFITTLISTAIHIQAKENTTTSTKIKKISISPQVALATLGTVAAASLISPIAGLLVVTASVYAASNPKKVNKKIEKIVEIIEDKDEINTFARKVKRTIRRFLEDILED